VEAMDELKGGNFRSIQSAASAYILRFEIDYEVHNHVRKHTKISNFLLLRKKRP
jgi:hypothetical protein